MTLLDVAAVAYQLVLTKADKLRRGRSSPTLRRDLEAELARKPGRPSRA